MRQENPGRNFFIFFWLFGVGVTFPLATTSSVICRMGIHQISKNASHIHDTLLARDETRYASPFFEKNQFLERKKRGAGHVLALGRLIDE
jgi:hypothetical protein